MAAVQAQARGELTSEASKGASLPDPQHLFNGGLEAKASRSIDLAKGDNFSDAALKELVRAAVAANAKKR